MVKQEIQMENVSFSYEQEPLFVNFSLRLKAGAFVAIVGANGSGKSTLLQLLSGIRHPNKGMIHINGMRMQQDSENALYIARNLISVVLQNPEDQFVGATVEEDIAFGLENQQKTKQEMVRIIAEVSKKMQLQSFLHKAPHELSGGQKQRVALASCLAMGTKYLLLDEATSQLDPQGKQEVLKAIRELAKQKNKTVIMVTHDLSEILHADRVLVLQKGKIAIDTKPQMLFSSYADRLATYGLVLPQVVQYSKQFAAAGLIDGDAFSIEELVNKVCK